MLKTAEGNYRTNGERWCGSLAMNTVRSYVVQWSRHFSSSFPSPCFLISVIIIVVVFVVILFVIECVCLSPEIMPFGRG